VTETPKQLRRTGRIVLVCGLIAAVLVYWVEARGASHTAAFEHTRSSDNQMGRMMGHMGVEMADWQATLTSPAGYAAGVTVLSLLFAGYFYRVASVTDEEMRDRERDADR